MPNKHDQQGYVCRAAAAGSVRAEQQEPQGYEHVRALHEDPRYFRVNQGEPVLPIKRTDREAGVGAGAVAEAAEFKATCLYQLPGTDICMCVVLTLISY